jgi:hypothetical protein
MNQSLFDPLEFIHNWIEFGLRLLSFFWLVFLFRNTRVAFLYYQLVSGARGGEFVKQLTLLNKQKPDDEQLSCDKLKSFQRFLNVSTTAMIQAKAIKEGQFEIGYLSMINTDKLVSLNEYCDRVRLQLNNGFPLWELASVDIMKINQVIDSFSDYHKPVSAYILYIIQSECLKAIGCPFYKWYAHDYYIALFNLMTLLYAKDSKECFTNDAITEIELRLSTIGVVDNLTELRFLLEDKETCSIGLTLDHITGDQY